MQSDFDSIIRKEINKVGKLWDIPNIMCGFIVDGRIEQIINWNNDFLNIKPIPENSIFCIGSNSKAFAGSALMQLSNQYNFDINAPVIEYYPEFQLYDKKLTHKVCVKDLVTHNIGLGKFTCSMMGFLNYSQSDIISSMKYFPIIKPFRSSFQYHNGFYLIVEEIIVGVTKSSIKQLYSKGLFNKLIMDNTTTSLDTITLDQVATPYVDVGGKNAIITQSAFSECFGIGTNLKTTITDMTKWLLFNINLFSSGFMGEFSHYQNQFKRYVNFSNNEKTYLNEYIKWEGYSLGWYSNKISDFDLYEHLGGVPGYTSYLSFIPELKAGIVLLCNKSGMRYPLELVRLMFFHTLINKITNLDISYRLFDKTMDDNNSILNKVNIFKPTKLPISYKKLELFLFNSIYKDINFKIYGNEISIFFKSSGQLFNCFYAEKDIFVIIDHLHHFSTLFKLVTLKLDIHARTLLMTIYMDNQQGGLSLISDHLFIDNFS